MIKLNDGECFVLQSLSDGSQQTRVQLSKTIAEHGFNRSPVSLRLTISRLELRGFIDTFRPANQQLPYKYRITELGANTYSNIITKW